MLSYYFLFNILFEFCISKRFFKAVDCWKLTTIKHFTLCLIITWLKLIYFSNCVDWNSTILNIWGVSIHTCACPVRYRAQRNGWSGPLSGKLAEYISPVLTSTPIPNMIGQCISPRTVVLSSPTHASVRSTSIGNLWNDAKIQIGYVNIA